MLPPQIPGFIYDETKKKYFKIVNGSVNESTRSYHNSVSQVEKRRRTRENQNNHTHSNGCIGHTDGDTGSNNKKYRHNHHHGSGVVKKESLIVKLSKSLEWHRHNYQNSIDKLDITSIRIGLKSYTSNLTLLKGLLKPVTSNNQPDKVRSIFECNTIANNLENNHSDAINYNNRTLPDCVVFKRNWSLSVIRNNVAIQVEAPNPEINPEPENLPTTSKVSSLWFSSEKQEIRLVQFNRELLDGCDINLTNYFVYRQNEWHQEEVLLRYLAERKGLENVCKLIGKGKNFHDFVTSCKLFDDLLIFGSCSGELVITNIGKLDCISQRLIKDSSIVYISDLILGVGNCNHNKNNNNDITSKCFYVGTHNGHLFLVTLEGRIIHKLRHSGSIRKVYQIDPQTILVISTTKVCTYSLLTKSEPQLIREFPYSHDNLLQPVSNAFFWNNNGYFIISELKYKLRLFEINSGNSIEFYASENDEIVNLTITKSGHVYIFMKQSVKEFNWLGLFPN